MSDRSVEDRSSRDAAGNAARDSVKRKRGGKRVGAGRKRGRFRKPEHRKRPELLPKHPVHVTLRMQVFELRNRRMYHMLRKVLALYLAFPGFRIIHISIQNNHLHLIVEAANRKALTRGMQSFSIRAARAINRERGIRGKVFKYRYHATQITTPRQARNCLAYVLNNWRRHREDVTSKGIMAFPYDPYSSAFSFDGWTKRYEIEMPAEYVPLPVSPPTTALLRSDYKRCGLIDPYECPGPRW